METNVFFFFRLPAFNPDFETPQHSLFTSYGRVSKSCFLYRHYRVGAALTTLVFRARLLYLHLIYSPSLSIYWEVGSKRIPS